MKVRIFYTKKKKKKKKERKKEKKVVHSQDKQKVTTAIYLVKSELIFGQEVGLYVSAPNTSLNKLQSVDNKAIKLAIGVHVHINTIKSFAEAGMKYLSEN